MILFLFSFQFRFYIVTTVATVNWIHNNLFPWLSVCIHRNFEVKFIYFCTQRNDVDGIRTAIFLSRSSFDSLSAVFLFISKMSIEIQEVIKTNCVTSVTLNELNAWVGWYFEFSQTGSSLTVFNFSLISSSMWSQRSTEQCNSKARFEYRKRKFAADANRTGCKLQLINQHTVKKRPKHQKNMKLKAEKPATARTGAATTGKPVGIGRNDLRIWKIAQIQKLPDAD